jgi:hypothetical protein
MHEFVVQLMEGVEDIPAAALNEGLSWDWETFPEYLDALDSRNYACDIGMFIAHGPVRAYVLGERCNDSDKPGGPFKYPVTDAEIAEMSEVVRDAVAAGALGFSTNRLGGHRDGQGVCVPGTLGSAYEYTQLAKGAALGGGGVAQFVSDFSSYDDIPRDQMDPKKQQVRKTSSCAPFYTKTRRFANAMPRQARDKHRENSRKRAFFSRQMRGQQDWEALTFVSAEYGLKCLVSMGLPNDKNGTLGSIEGNTQRMRQMEDDGGAKPPSLCVCVYALWKMI